MQNIPQFDFAVMDYKFDAHVRLVRDFESEKIDLRFTFLNDALEHVDF